MSYNVWGIFDDWHWYNTPSGTPVPNVGVCRAKAISQIYPCYTARTEQSEVRAQRGATGGSEFKEYFSIK